MSLTQVEDTWPLARDAENPILPPPRLAELREASENGLINMRMYDGLEATLMTTYDAVRETLLNEHMSSDGRRPGFPYVSEGSRFNRGGRTTIDRLDPPEHDEQRGMLLNNFTVKRVREYREFFEDLIERLFTEMEAKEARGEHPELVSDFAQPFPASAIARLLEFPMADAPFFIDRVNRWMDDKNTPEDITEAMDDITAYFEKLMEKRAGGAGDDLVTRLVRDQVVPGHLSKKQFLLTMHLMITGGFDTTANMIALGTIALLQRPDQWRLLVEDTDDERIEGAVEELLRFVSVAHNSPMRLTLRETEIQGVALPGGRAILPPQMAANHDPRHYKNPDQLDLTRDARDHLAFGLGLHQCIGQALARVELRIVFSKLPKRWPNLALAKPFTELTYKQQSMVYGVERVPLILNAGK